MEGPVTGAFWAHYPHVNTDLCQKTLRDTLLKQKTPLHNRVCAADSCVHERVGGGVGWTEWPVEEQWWERFCCPGHFRLHRTRLLLDVWPEILEYDSS